MDQLVGEIAAKTGITPDQAREAVQMVVNYVKTQLPAPLAGQIDGLMNAGASGDTLQQAETALQDLGGLFGKH